MSKEDQARRIAVAKMLNAQLRLHQRASVAVVMGLCPRTAEFKKMQEVEAAATFPQSCYKNLIPSSIGHLMDHDSRRLLVDFLR